MKISLIAILIAMLSVSTTVYAQDNDSILVDEYIISQDFVQAEIIRVRAIERTITVRGEKRGETRQFKIPEGAKITVRGREARMRDLRKGDIVLLAMKPKVGEVVITQIKAPSVPVTLEQRRAEPVVVNEVLPTVLPKTAGNLPLVLLFGMIFLILGGSLVARRKFNKVK